MADKKEQPFDLTEEANRHGDKDTTAAARRAESDDLYSGSSGLNNSPSPDGERAGENKVATSLSDE